MSALHCPAWDKPESNGQLPHIIRALRVFYSLNGKACHQAASAFVEFIRIHPFLNGNGRVGRMVVNYVFKLYGYAMPFSQSYVRPPEHEYAVVSAAAMGSNSDSKPFYRYLLNVFARNP